MKKLALIILAVISVHGHAQEGWQFGLNISPSYKLNMAKLQGTGLRTNTGGYGFNLGVPVKYWFNEFTAFNTGLDFEYSAFDSYNNGYLDSSFRFNSLHLPLMFNFHLSGSFYAMAGTGVNYNLRVTDLNSVQSAVVTDLTNKVQPYLGLGVNSLMEKDFGTFEVGVLGRYQLLDIWQADKKPFQSINSHLLTIELLLRFYI